MQPASASGASDHATHRLRAMPIVLGPFKRGPGGTTASGSASRAPLTRAEEDEILGYGPEGV